MSQAHYTKVAALMDHVDDVSEWEYDFIMHMADFEERGNMFTENQKRTIDQLHERLCE